LILKDKRKLGETKFSWQKGVWALFRFIVEVLTWIDEFYPVNEYESKRFTHTRK